MVVPETAEAAEMEECLEKEEWTESVGFEVSRDLKDKASNGELVTEERLPTDPRIGGGGGGGAAEGGISGRVKKSERFVDNYEHIKETATNSLMVKRLEFLNYVLKPV